MLSTFSTTRFSTLREEGRTQQGLEMAAEREAKRLR